MKNTTWLLFLIHSILIVVYVRLYIYHDFLGATHIAVSTLHAKKLSLALCVYIQVCAAATARRRRYPRWLCFIYFLATTLLSTNISWRRCCVRDNAHPAAALPAAGGNV